jgi:uncharacterized membrane protein YhaH (DUF805 family)
LTVEDTRNRILAQWRRHLISPRGRMARASFWGMMGSIGISFLVLFLLLDAVLGRGSTLLLYVPLYWAVYALAAKRYHDVGRAAPWLFLVFVPIVGVAWVAMELGLRKGSPGENRFGPAPADAHPHPEAT